ncbi:MAG TPA: hypothetical protein VF139_03845 [Candidatus Polarisedimenticolaceae bacterium]
MPRDTLRFVALTAQGVGLTMLLRAGRAYLAGREPSSARLGGGIAFGASLAVAATGLDAPALAALASGTTAGLGALARKPVPAAWFALGWFVLAVAFAVLR